MALPSWAKEEVTRIRPGTKESRGSVMPDWSEDKVSKQTIQGCSVQPASTTLSQDGRVLAISEGLTCFFPLGTDVAAGDKIRYDGEDYQIIGKPKKWTSPTGRVSNIQAQLERWSG